ncbi:MAG: alpha-L-arabinofuranosidase C-terminal domain-containing protein [Acidobacteriaceae bacterium]
MRNHEVVPVADMTGIMEFAGIWKARGQVFGAPGYYVFKMYATAHATRPVRVETNGGSYSVKRGVTRLPDIENAPYLDVVAALDKSGDRLTLFCVNRSLHTDIPADVSVDGFASTGTAKVQTLAAAYLSEGNDEVDPHRVTPVDSVDKVEAGKVHHTFPHASVTVITLDRSAQ